MHHTTQIIKLFHLAHLHLIFHPSLPYITVYVIFHASYMKSARQMLIIISSEISRDISHWIDLKHTQSLHLHLQPHGFVHKAMRGVRVQHVLI